jgi:hypothetical protein
MVRVTIQTNSRYYNIAKAVHKLFIPLVRGLKSKTVKTIIATLT